MAAAEKNPHRITYRIRGIPASCSQESFAILLTRALALQDDHWLQIRSFSSDVALPGDPPSRTAVVSFGETIPMLQKEERITLKTSQMTFLCDTVFDGFTPLSPVELEEENAIEQVDRPPWIDVANVAKAASSFQAGPVTL